jgi:CHAD domain-containing protein
LKQSRTTPKLNADKSLRSNLQTMLCSSVDTTFSELDGIAKTYSPDAIHDSRVAARRLRALLRVFRTAFSKKELKIFLRSLSLLIRSLGRVRDCDIIIENLNSVRHVLSREGQASIDLLIGNQAASRRRYTEALGKNVRQLEASEFRGSLRSFISSSLA